MVKSAVQSFAPGRGVGKTTVTLLHVGIISWEFLGNPLLFASG
jgi:hypothetical protein